VPTPGNEIICYDGRTLAVNVRPLVQVEARRGRRWGWFGAKGWWVHLHLFHGWHIQKFVLTLSEAGVTPIVPASPRTDELTTEFVSPFADELTAE
jgi:hypothetical protein